MRHAPSQFPGFPVPGGVSVGARGTVISGNAALPWSAPEAARDRSATDRMRNDIRGRCAR